MSNPKEDSLHALNPNDNSIYISKVDIVNEYYEYYDI